MILTDDSFLVIFTSKHQIPILRAWKLFLRTEQFFSDRLHEYRINIKVACRMVLVEWYLSNGVLHGLTPTSEPFCHSPLFFKDFALYQL
ncbi:hypothetical protein SAMD00079811_76790 (plasmid) [Scytonema sp. HK-05]|uniref:hypothetical protein n=1 Tax=Scytonema sp. HK-05 TaxID=1137095 RepID=UPI000AB324D4|nr:hypothetical protein [Scytonema sp. HK-05]BAY50050.1 hypothetical protein SAMD00079811_76790 [Scytonema sp. HK-05]